jgi:asparagine synthase (glutamine-hydrolysing)
VPAVVSRLPVSHAKVSFDYKAKRFVTGAYLSPAAGHLWWKTILDEDAKAALYGDGVSTGRLPTARLFESLYAESDGGELDRLQYVDGALYLPDDILVKVDRMSMAHSLEARVPFLANDMLELSRRIPAELRLRGLTTKYLLKRAMASRLPASVVGGKKRGFNVPMPQWLAGELREFMQDTLAPARIRAQGLFEPAAVDRLVGQHVRREHDHSRALWTLLVLSAWMDAVLGAGRQTASRAAGGTR